MKRNAKRLAAALCIGAALGILLAGCGGGSKSASTATGSGTLSGSIK